MAWVVRESLGTVVGQIGKLDERVLSTVKGTRG